MRLDDLFTVKNGIPATGVELSQRKGVDTIPFLRPSNSQRRTLAGWAQRSKLPKKAIHPAESIFVSTNGEGSHTYAYVTDFEFAANSDVAILVPKIHLSLPEKIFYARCISGNRYKFSYGRKPKGEKLKMLELPSSPPWVAALSETYSYTHILDDLDAYSAVAPASAPVELGKALVPLNSLFKISGGNKLDLNKMKMAKCGVPFVARTSKNNGVVARVANVPKVAPYPAGLITVALGGSVLTSSYQMQPFYTAQNVAVLEPIEKMTLELLIYYCAAIKANAFRFNACGREANRFLKDLVVPAMDAVPGWAYGSIARTRKDVEGLLG